MSSLEVDEKACTSCKSTDESHPRTNSWFNDSNGHDEVAATNAGVPILLPRVTVSGTKHDALAATNTEVPMSLSRETLVHEASPKIPSQIISNQQSTSGSRGMSPAIEISESLHSEPKTISRQASQSILADSSQNEHQMVTRAKSGIYKPNPSKVFEGYKKDGWLSVVAAVTRVVFEGLAQWSGARKGVAAQVSFSAGVGPVGKVGVVAIGRRWMGSDVSMGCSSWAVGLAEGFGENRWVEVAQWGDGWAVWSLFGRQFDLERSHVAVIQNLAPNHLCWKGYGGQDIYANRVKCRIRVRVTDHK
ncbi:hypothetical protein NE237_019189 [Protea cynaroides]|uniref:Uncharacterized protein n=1 Tax=Protea cynaroides TaxID=273540 RepID=A0A9Q0KBE8_9MAGN|nr:hypothetical protein NE237_019189 [Protea cynaroides]